MNTILLILCNALSCFIISNILFQFMNGKYKRSSQNRYAYIVIEAVTVIFTTCINMLNHSILNLVVWGVLTGIIAYALYYEDMDCLLYTSRRLHLRWRIAAKRSRDLYMISSVRISLSEILAL